MNKEENQTITDRELIEYGMRGGKVKRNQEVFKKSDEEKKRLKALKKAHKNS